MTPQAKGSDFEKLVASWAKVRFKAEEVKVNDQVKGTKARQPYDVDVHVVMGPFVAKTHMWLECKNREEKVDRDDVLNLKAKAEDVGAGWFWFDHLGIVTTSGFTKDAVELANAYGVGLFLCDGADIRLVNRAVWPKLIF